MAIVVKQSANERKGSVKINNLKPKGLIMCSIKMMMKIMMMMLIIRMIMMVI